MPLGVVYTNRPRVIVFDILGTASKSGFLERILFPYLKINLDTFINTHWDRPDFLILYNRIQDQSSELNRRQTGAPLVLDHNAMEAKGSLIQFINFVTDNNVNSPAVTQMRFKVWFEGYQQSRLRTPIYTDVSNALRRWNNEGIKFYVFSNTWVEAQKALLRNTNHGDLTSLITEYFDNDFGLLNELDSWRRFCAQIREQPPDVLFLTKSVVEGRAAQEAGLAVCLVLTHRHNVKALSHDDCHRFPFVRTLNDLHWREGSVVATSMAQEAPSGAAPAPSVSAAGGIMPHTSGTPTAISTSTAPLIASTPTGATASTAMHSSQATSGVSGASSKPSSLSRSRRSRSSKSSSRASSRAASAASSHAPSRATQGTTSTTLPTSSSKPPSKP